MKRWGSPTPAQERALLHALLYAAVFDYPLTLDQLHESLIGVRARAEDVRAWYAASPALQAVIEYRDGYFFPRGRGDVVDLRRAREVISRSLLKNLARPLALVLNMPFVRMVALTGSLAHLNAAGTADLDLFLVTRANRVWTVTTLLLIVSRLLGWRRHLCLNYVVSERQLAVAPKDLFSANQIVHLRPLCGADVYRRFLAANRFVRDYYPNFRARDAAGLTRAPFVRAIEMALDGTVAALVERCCRAAYRWHLLRRAHTWETRDQVRLEPECLKLHTSSHREAVMEKFRIAIAEAERITRAAAVPAQVGR